MAMKRRVRLDNEVDLYLSKVISNLRAMGLKNVQRPDAIRYIIKMNEASNLRAKRKKRSKEVYFE